jgi:hypothetical protein
VVAFLVLLFQCSLFNDANSQDDTDLGTLQVMEKTLSVQVGETRVISVVAKKADGSRDTVSADCSGGCVQPTVEPDQSISVQGLSLGERMLSITSGAGRSASVTVRVYDPKAMMTSGLAVTYTDQFTWRWDDSGSGYSQDGAFYHPVAPAGYYALGSIGQSKRHGRVEAVRLGTRRVGPLWYC